MIAHIPIHIHAVRCRESRAAMKSERIHLVVVARVSRSLMDCRRGNSVGCLKFGFERSDVTPSFTVT